MNLKRLLLLGGTAWVVVSLMGFPGGAGKNLHASNDLVGEPAPPPHVETWLTPRPQLNGRMLLIDFWATWCPPCRAAIPELNEWSRRFADRLVVIGLSDEPPAQVQAMTSPRIEYFSAVDTQARMKNAVGVQGIPHVLLIDPEGIVRWQGFPFEQGHRLTTEVIEQLLDQYVP